MNYGDELQVLENGPFIAPKLLQMMGISDGTTCWGLWTTSSSKRNKNRREANKQLPHMMISPIHPDLWPISFQMRVMLRDQPGTLANFLDAISDCPLDIQFSQATFAGYDRIILNSLYTFSDLNDWKIQFLKFYLNKQNKRLNKAWLEADKLFQDQSSQTGKSSKQEPTTGDYFFDAVVGALGIANQDIQIEIDEGDGLNRTFDVPKGRNPVAVDAIRRNALEWLGRQVVARLTALWIVVWSKDSEHYLAAWEKWYGDKSPEDIVWKNLDFDMDPEGDYFFPRKSVQTGRRPWNIEIPFPPSWDKHWKKKEVENDDYRRQKNDDLWEGKSEILYESEVPWIKKSRELIEDLYDHISQTKDLIHATRPGTDQPRLTLDCPHFLYQGL